MSKIKCVVVKTHQSGTSLMMRLLQILGMDVVGENQSMTTWLESNATPVSIDEKIKARFKRLQKSNPGNLFEIPDVINTGTADVEKYSGKVIKISATAAIPTNNGGTPAEIVEKYILCLRDPIAAVVNQQNLDKGLHVAIHSEGTPYSFPPPNKYIKDCGELLEWLVNNPDEIPKWLIMDYDELLSSSAVVIERIRAHLQIDPIPSQLVEAVNSINPLLRCSVKGAEWKVPELGDLAYKIYKALKTGENREQVLTEYKNI